MLRSCLRYRAAIVPRRAAPLRFMSAKKDEGKKPESLLNDDLLASAGIDVESTKPKTEGSQEGSQEGSEESQEETRKKWAETARKAREEQSTMENRTRRNNYFYLVSGFSILAALGYSARPLDENEAKHNPDVPNDWAPGSIWQRIKGRIGGTFDYFNDPAFEKLLPDPLPAPYGRPMTLVLALDDFLVKSEWTREHGWRTAKRPGVDYFLGYLAQYYEVVIFSSKYQAFDQEIILKLDPYRASISYSLFREASRFKDGKVIKDLSHLNRDLSKVVVVDVDENAVSLQRDNALVVPPWKGNPDDQELIRLIPLLEWIGAQPIKDVRPVLKSYENKDVIREFERRDKISRENWKKTHSGSQGAWASKMLGVAPKNPDLMPQDYVRIEGQKGYQQFQKYLKEHGDKMLEEEKKREAEIMKEHKMTINKYVTQGGPTPEELAATMARKEAEAQAAASAHSQQK
ncbi:Mitochondrial import inner membrane translocase subunit TIM50 [Wickerhamiella sorbophila]|uniref:Mitochondrial import inner membrane translocase subunit TIM50 n=1 Tax=Wickerhamiella sorbophila TaxID=45607 RepID=A0A2T0FCY6_9ASCO|nr:Mitochondrial import inner membrane translocase subunit TIM50 [Wickerhamiella sorbophila]PRT52868.1 Mitochondrial import inner membrane translocase subunit TIM50 [Wickerhamiella sorbophila]